MFGDGLGDGHCTDDRTALADDHVDGVRRRLVERLVRDEHDRRRPNPAGRALILDEVAIDGPVVAPEDADRLTDAILPEGWSLARLDVDDLRLGGDAGLAHDERIDGRGGESGHIVRLRCEWSVAADEGPRESLPGHALYEAKSRWPSERMVGYRERRSAHRAAIASRCLGFGPLRAKPSISTPMLAWFGFLHHEPMTARAAVAPKKPSASSVVRMAVVRMLVCIRPRWSICTMRPVYSMT